MMKKLSLSLLAIAAVSALVMGGTFALFTAQATNAGNTFTAGTVSFDNPSSTLVDVTNIAPGDSGTETYTVEYNGSLNAYIGYDLDLEGDLFSCDGANSLEISVNGGAWTRADATAIQLTNAALNQFVDEDEATITIDWRLPSAAGNSCQGDSATMALEVYAVQAANNNNGSDGPTSWN